MRWSITITDNGGDCKNCMLLGKHDTNEHPHYVLDLPVEVIDTIVDVHSLCNFVKKLANEHFKNFMLKGHCISSDSK